MSKIISIPILLISLTSCTDRITDFTLLTTKNIDIQDMSKYGVAEGKRVSGIDTKHIIIIIPTGTPSVKQAIDNAIEENEGCVGLTDGVIHSDWFYIPYSYRKKE